MKLSKEYVPALDGFRGIAISLVILSHYGLGHFIPGGFGVNLFFFISGLLITRLLIIETKETGKINLKSFYIRRILRLYPALLFFVTVSTIYLLICGSIYIKPGEILATLFYYRNYYPHIADFVYAPKEFNVFHIVWSLSIEEHFYIIFPFLFLVLYKRLKTFIAVIIALIVAAAVWRLALINMNGGIVTDELGDRIHFLTDTRF